MDLRHILQIGGQIGGFLLGALPFFRFVFRNSPSEKQQMLKGANITFNDVIGCDEAKEAMKDIIMYLRSPKQFESLGAQRPGGILITGRPGTGKTLIARAVAGEAGASFHSMSWEALTHEIKNLFKRARESAPSVVFIDELISPTEYIPSVRHLLLELDSAKNAGVAVIAATNFPQGLHKELTYAGRFDRTVELQLPDVHFRQGILQVRAKNITLDINVSLHAIAKRTAGMTGRDLGHIINTATVRSSVEKLPTVPMEYLEEAVDSVRRISARPDITFDHVKGCGEAKKEMKEVIMYLQDPGRFASLGAKLSKGILMTGPPGTGKTLMARAVAGEAKASFLHKSASEFIEKYVGVGALRIREFFAEAREHIPCIVFIDELDAVGGARSTSVQDSGGDSEQRQTLNQLLTELDGFKQNEGLILIAATNTPGSLDRALTRPGRFDKQIVLQVPDLLGRHEILQLYAKNITLDCDVDLHLLAKRTTGMTGADLANILNLAAIQSAVDQLAAVPMSHVDEAFDRVVVGAARRSFMSQQDKKTIAYHEGGHALVSLKTRGSEPLHKATILPRGNALGITWSMPGNDDRVPRTLSQMQAELDMAMGGRVAEEVVFGSDNISSGCSNDLKQATELARHMVMNFGMGGGAETVSVYLDDAGYRAMSDQAKYQLDSRVQKLLREAYTRVVKLLRRHQDELHRLADALIQHETLDAEGIRLAVCGRSPVVPEFEGHWYKASIFSRYFLQVTDFIRNTCIRFADCEQQQTIGHEHATNTTKKFETTLESVVWQMETQHYKVEDAATANLEFSPNRSKESRSDGTQGAESLLDSVDPQMNISIYLLSGVPSFFLLVAITLKKIEGPYSNRINVEREQHALIHA